MKSGLITAMTLLAGPALAGEFTPPEGCEGWLTVQHRSCQVANHYNCAADGPDIYCRVLFNGAFRTSYINGTREVYNLDPVEFILPGEFGFFSDVPKYDCGPNISLNLSERIKHHDF